MDILEELDQAHNKLTVCYSVIQLQSKTIEELSEKITHLEKLLLYTPTILTKE
jgi:hypothetical protein